MVFSIYMSSNLIDLEISLLKNIAPKYNKDSSINVTNFLQEYIRSFAWDIALIDHRIEEKGENKKEWENIIQKQYRNAPLQHYTSFSALFSIIASKKLLLSQFSNMNDKKDGKIFLKSLEMLLKEGMSNHIKNGIEEKLNCIKAMSFSLAIDDNSQWDRYGDNGAGVCLVSNIDKLNSLFSRYDENPTVFPIKYVNDANELYKHNLMVPLRKFDQISKSSDEFTDAFLCISSCFKHISFSSEREVRLFFIKDDMSKVDNEIFSYLENNGSEKNKKNLVVNLDILNSKNNKTNNSSFFGCVFSKIIIGPRAKIAVKDLQFFLEQYGITDVIVEKSSSSVRY